MKKISILILTAVLMVCTFAFGNVLAAEPGQILSFGSEDGKIVLYVQNPGGPFETEALVGTSEPENITITEADFQKVPVRTVLLLDNSLSIKEKDRDAVKNIMTEIVANRMPGEKFTVATFDKKVNYILNDSDNYSEVKQAIDGIKFINQDSYLSDAMYELITDINGSSEPAFTRIVLIADGVDNNYIGYSKNELYQLIEDHPYPIYTVGCSGGADSEQLKDMFAMSRMTGAEQFLLDDIIDPKTVASGVASTNNAVRIELEPKAKDCDGSTKGVSIILKTPDGDLKDTVQVRMPSVKIVETIPDDAAGETIAATVSDEEILKETIEEMPERDGDDDEKAETDADDDDSEDNSGENDEDKTLFEKFRDSKFFVPVIIGIIVIICGIIAVSLIVSDQKKKKAAAAKARAAENRAAAMRARQENQLRQNVTAISGNAGGAARPGSTVMASQNGNTPGQGAARQPQTEHRTVMLKDQEKRRTEMMNDAVVQAKTLVLQDISNAYKHFEVSLSAPILVGYNQNCQVRLNYEETVSGEHCLIYQKDDKIMIQNRSKTNGTAVDGVKITSETEIRSGSRLGIGKLTLTVEIRQ